MLCIITDNTDIHLCLAHTLKLTRFTAGDVDICTKSPITNALPVTAYTSADTLLLFSEDLCSTQFLLGVLCSSVSFIRNIVFVKHINDVNIKDQNINNTIYTALSLKHSNKDILYLDVLSKWFDAEVSLADDTSYAIAKTIMRFWNSHHAQIMVVRYPSHSREELEKKLIKSFESLNSVPLHCMGRGAQKQLMRLHDVFNLSYTQRNALYNILKSIEIMTKTSNSLNLDIDSVLEEYIQKAIHYKHKQEKKVLFINLCKTLQTFKQPYIQTI